MNPQPVIQEMKIRRVKNGHMIEQYVVYENDKAEGWVPVQWAYELPVLLNEDLLEKEIRIHREEQFLPDADFDDVPF